MLSGRDVEIIFFCFARKNVKIALIGNVGVLTEIRLLFFGNGWKIWKQEKIFKDVIIGMIPALYNIYFVYYSATETSFIAIRCLYYKHVHFSELYFIQTMKIKQTRKVIKNIAT